MTLYGPSIPIRVQPVTLPDPGPLPGPRPGEVPDRGPVEPARAPAGDSEPVSAFMEVDR